VASDTFQQVYARDVDTIFKVTDGGRIFTQLVSVLSDNTVVLDVIAGGKNNAYYHLGGVVIDEYASNITLLRNDTTLLDDDGDHVVRFTDGHFRNSASAVVNRTIGNGTGNSGRTILEFVGCRGLASLHGLTTGNVVLKSNADDATRKNRAVLSVRDCDLSDLASTDIVSLIDSQSTNYRAWGRDNWTFASGKVQDSESVVPNP
jgi:hypothetical protein